MFERKGFLSARVSDITTRAKISYGTFYHYFDSKESIFLELAQLEEARLTSPESDDEGEEPAAEPTAAERIQGKPTVATWSAIANRPPSWV